MSIKDMFLLANQLQDRSNGLNNIKDYLKVENAINQNWQDALTFDKNVAAINAANAKKAYDDILGLEKAQGERAALGEYARNLYDPNTLSYRSEEVAHQMAAPFAAKTNNPYAMAANYQAHRAAALQKANAIAAIDPAQAHNLNNQAWGNAGISAYQLPDGTLRVQNSQGYTRNIADPNHAAMYGADPLKTSSTLAGWKRDDQVSTRDYMEQMGLNADQAQHNRTNNELSLRLQHQLNQEANRDNAALKWDYALKEADYKQKVAAEQAKLQGNKTQNIDPKIMADVFNNNMKLAIESGAFSDYQSAYNAAQEATKDFFGMGEPKSEPNMVDITGASKEQPNIAQKAQSGSAQAAEKDNLTTGEMRHNLTSFAPATRFGFYHQQAGFPHNTRGKAIEQAQANIKHLENLIAQNQAINPNAHIVANQKAALARWQAELAQLNQIPERHYYQNHNPFSAAWNWVWTGDSLPDTHTYHK